jgi:phenylacetate-CoA ligase
MGRADQIYARLPVWAQHLAVTVYGAYWNRLRFGGEARELAEGYRVRDRWSTEAWQTWQHAELTALLAACASHVPYYRDTWSDADKAAAHGGRLDKLPLLGKDPIRAEPRRFLHDGIRPRRPLVFHTSGSTGTPIASMWTVREYRDAMAVREVRSASWAGVSFTRPRATFSGRIAVPDPQSTGPYHRYNAIEKQAYLSPFHLRRETAAQYVEALRDHGIEWLTGYAVSFYLLARFILEERLSVPPLRAVITTSEKVTQTMRATMEQAYGCRVFEEYSTVENALFASECDHGSLHVSPDWGIVELLRPDGSPAAPGEEGEVVATSLRRRYQPLIRFRLGDVAVWSERACACGRAMPVLEAVVGRIEDVIVGPDGREMVRFHGIFTDQPHVREGQIVQESLDRIRVKVVPAPGFGPADSANIIARMHQRLGAGVAITVDLVDAIPRTKAGKYQAVVSLLRGQRAGVETTGVER